MARAKGKVGLMPKRGHLIVFEWLADVARAKFAVATAEALKRAGVAHQLVFVPEQKAGTLGEHISHLHRDPKAFGIKQFSGAAGAVLQIAARIDVIERVVLPALQAGEHVILNDCQWARPETCKDILDALTEAERHLWTDQGTTLFTVEGQAAPNRAADETYWSRLVGNIEGPGQKGEMCSRIVRLRDRQSTGSAIEVVLRALAMDKIVKKLVLRPGTGTSASGQLAMPFASATGPKAQSRAVTTPVFVARMSSATPTVVLDTYWRFASERQEIFFRRLEGKGSPWTRDPILMAHKFTNAYRASDRVSQFLIKDVIYGSDLPQSVNEVCFRILLFKLFNKIETWRLLEQQFGAVVYEEYSYKRYDQILSRAMSEGRRIYSAAYIMPPGGNAFGQTAKHQNHLRLLEMMMRDDVPKRLANMKRMQDAFELLRSFPTIGNFLAYQLATDINYSTVTDFTEMEFVMPGPGALDGIRKCFSSLGNRREPDIIRLMVDKQAEEFERLGLNFRSLFGRPLQLIDCQNLFCEVDKYSRVAHPEFAGHTGRSRIKQKFSPISSQIDFWYPPKWRLNEAVEKFHSGRSRDRATEAARGRSSLALS